MLLVKYFSTYEYCVLRLFLFSEKNVLVSSEINLINFFRPSSCKVFEAITPDKIWNKSSCLKLPFRLVLMKSTAKFDIEGLRLAAVISNNAANCLKIVSSLK